MTIPMQKPIEDDEYIDGIVDLDDYDKNQNLFSKEDEEKEDIIDLQDYSKSQEAEESTWWDSLKEAGVQSASGLGQAFTYPLDILKIAMIGEGLTDIDEIEEAFENSGKPFDRNKYIQTIMEQGEFIPTQKLLEKTIDKYAGTNIADPKTRTGKFFNKLFFLGGLTRGKGFKQAAKAGIAGATTTSALREIGAPEIVSELAGDVIGGLVTLEKQARNFTSEQKRIIDLSEKHGLPLMEFMLEDTAGSTAKISPLRKAAFEKELGMTTEVAINKIIEGKIPIAELRKQGQNLQVLEDEAYNKATELAKSHKDSIDTTEIINDINREISRIKSLAPSPSNAEQAAIRVLQAEKKKLTAPKKKTIQLVDAQGKPLSPTPPKGKMASAKQLIEQTKNYNSNVKGIYKKAEFNGSEDEVKNAYAFLNDRIRNTLENQAGKELVDAHRAANSIFAQNSKLARTEGLISKAFPNGEFNAKKLNQVLNTKQGAILRRDIGEDGIRELRQIAEYGEKAQKATSQFANSSKHSFQMGEWGPLAGFVLAKVPGAGVAAAAAKPMFDYVRGYLLTSPVARKTYADIMKNAANGSFKNMAKDFSTLEKQIIKDFGSIEDFMKQGIRELPFYKPGEED